jgi:3-oxoacyl-[acyl-carrier protein] reductase
MKLKNKVALITGSTSGIGEAIAVLFAAEGAKIAVVGSRDIERAQRVVDRIAKAGGSAKPFASDLREVKQIESLVGAVIDSFGRIDILVNSAGVFYPTPIGETTEADYDSMADINVKGTYFCINAVAPIMKEQGGGKIINLSSVSGIMGMATCSAYCATKSAINIMTKALAVELAPHGIAVNAILPGNTATPMNEDVRTKPEFKPRLDAMTAHTPSPRTYSDPEDMAEAALFLASDSTRAMHGSLMLLDEGISAGM